ncbi:MAG: histidinol dehydrogenase [Bacteroidia bacterium]
MTIINYPDQKDWPKLLARPVLDTKQLEGRVAEILRDVKRDGDKALRKYTLQLDKADVKNFVVSGKEISAAKKQIDRNLKKAIAIAQQNITRFHASQIEKPKIVETMKGVSCWRRSVAIEKVGLYIPGGTAPLFSTLLMLGIPAKLAGCREIILCTPPGKNGTIAPEILYTANVLGITSIYKIGGAQAIAAMAYGTETVPAIYKLFGPGNQYVTCAKQLINKEGIAIDMPAGPSELAVLADTSCVPAFVAADLLSQAEHGADSQVMLVSESKAIISEVLKELNAQIKQLPRKEIAEKALQNSKAFLIKNKAEALKLLNAYAPEHLIMACRGAEKLSVKIENAGSVFLGNYSCESAGDYASGTNHTLPTNGFARAYSGVSLDSFVKKITYQNLSKKGILALGKTIGRMAEAEGLFAHKNAVDIRMKELGKQRD